MICDIYSIIEISSRVCCANLSSLLLVSHYLFQFFPLNSLGGVVLKPILGFSQFSLSVMSDSLWSHGQHTRLPCPSQLPKLAQIHVHRVGDAIQSSNPLSSPSPPAFNLSQHQGLFQWVSSLYQVGKVLEFQLQHQSLQWIFRTDFLKDWLVFSPCSPRDS